jgi:hypothetical protein
MTALYLVVLLSLLWTQIYPIIMRNFEDRFKIPDSKNFFYLFSLNKIPTNRVKLSFIIPAP